jgi:hypothetical protein
VKMFLYIYIRIRVIGEIRGYKMIYS